MMATRAGTITAPSGEGRPDDILVVSANLAETHDPADVAKTDDMKAFAERADELLPRPPDVVLLQEVVGSSVNAVVKYLKQATSATYTVGIWPAPKSPRLANSTSDYVRDTAILLNSETTVEKGKKGFITTRYDPKDKSTHWALARVKEHSAGMPTSEARLNCDLTSCYELVNLPPACLLSSALGGEEGGKRRAATIRHRTNSISGGEPCTKGESH